MPFSTNRMNPEEKVLLERTLKLSEENNRILRKLQSRARWAVAWGFIKIAILIIPLVAGYIFLEPYFEQLMESYSGIRELINLPR